MQEDGWKYLEGSLVSPAETAGTNVIDLSAEPLREMMTGDGYKALLHQILWFGQISRVLSHFQMNQDPTELTELSSFFFFFF